LDAADETNGESNQNRHQTNGNQFLDRSFGSNFDTLVIIRIDPLFMVFEEGLSYAFLFYYEPFTVYSAYYQVSFKVQGVEFTKEELASLLASVAITIRLTPKTGFERRDRL
jgi:hypothetical protein